MSKSSEYELAANKDLYECQYCLFHYPTYEGCEFPISVSTCLLTLLRERDRKSLLASDNNSGSLNAFGCTGVLNVVALSHKISGVQETAESIVEQYRNE